VFINSPIRAKNKDFCIKRPSGEAGKSEIGEKVGENPMNFSIEQKSGGFSQNQTPLKKKDLPIGQVFF
jgi:hypothetical protein